MQGEEEKEGRGECSCNAGYEGAACEDCSEGYYNESDSCLGEDRLPIPLSDS